MCPSTSLLRQPLLGLISTAILGSVRLTITVCNHHVCYRDISHALDFRCDQLLQAPVATTSPKRWTEPWNCESNKPLLLSLSLWENFIRATGNDSNIHANVSRPLPESSFPTNQPWFSASPPGVDGSEVLVTQQKANMTAIVHFLQRARI